MKQDKLINIFIIHTLTLFDHESWLTHSPLVVPHSSILLELKTGWQFHSTAV